MAVFDSLWWDLWWPWMPVWGGTVVAIVATVMITITHRRRHRRTAMRGTDQSCRHDVFYLNNDKVMALYQQEHGATLTKNIKITILKEGKRQVSTNFAPAGASASNTVSRTDEEDRTLEDKPITAIGSIIDMLDKADGIVYVDLIEQEIARNDALGKVLRLANNDFPNTVPLRNMQGYVSVLGNFSPVEPAQPNESTAAVQAYYGDWTKATGDHVHVTYEVSGRRGNPFPAGGSSARCLGRVIKWDLVQHRLDLDPIAIFLC